jgi:hypothetical protein
MPRTVVFIAQAFPHPVATFLAEHGYNVLEDHADEALSLADQQNVDAFIIADGQEYPGLAEFRQRRMTVNLTIHATAADVFFELSNLLSDTPGKPQ